MDIRYTLRLDQGQTEVFDTRLDPETGALVGRSDADAPAWTELGFRQCPNCPLDVATHPRCPLALSVVEIVERFRDVISHDEVEVEVSLPGRSVSARTTTQTALRSIMGLRIACSGCPHMDFFRPMARFHLPFADEAETMFRAVGSWLLSQYFRRADGRPATLDLAGLGRVYEQVQVVNRYTADRFRAATRQDASLNAVVLLDMYAQMAPFFIASALAAVRGPFEPFLRGLQAPSGAETDGANDA